MLQVARSCQIYPPDILLHTRNLALTVGGKRESVQTESCLQHEERWHNKKTLPNFSRLHLHSTYVSGGGFCDQGTPKTHAAHFAKLQQARYLIARVSNPSQVQYHGASQAPPPLPRLQFVEADAQQNNHPCTDASSSCKTSVNTASLPLAIYAGNLHLPIISTGSCAC